MKRFLVALGLVLAAGSALARPHVVYGQVEIGRVPVPPALLFPHPTIIVPGSAAPPMYLYVPRRHSHDWRRHCHRYGACGRQVYFVQDDWYRRHYYAPPPPVVYRAPPPPPAYYYRHRHHGYYGPGPGYHGHGHGHGHRHHGHGHGR